MPQQQMFVCDVFENPFRQRKHMNNMSILCFNIVYTCVWTVYLEIINFEINDFSRLFIITFTQVLEK